MGLWEFHVFGRAVPQGSVRPVVSATTGRTFVKQDPRVRDWRALVRDAAQQAGVALCSAARVEIAVEFARPKSHYGSGKNAETRKPTAPRRPTGKPDVDKLARAILDGLTGVAYLDDSAVVVLQIRKQYADMGTPERTTVVVERLDDRIAVIAQGGAP